MSNVSIYYPCDNEDCKNAEDGFKIKVTLPRNSRIRPPEPDDGEWEFEPDECPLCKTKVSEDLVLSMATDKHCSGAPDYEYEDRL